MLGLETRRRESLAPWSGEDLKRRVGGGVSPVALVSGLVALGLAAYLCYIFAPEVARTIKIHRM